jgi:hypothetical protein
MENNEKRREGDYVNQLDLLESDSDNKSKKAATIKKNETRAGTGSFYNVMRLFELALRKLLFRLRLHVY